MEYYCSGLSAVEVKSDLVNLGFEYVGHLQELYGDDAPATSHLARRDNVYVIYFDKAIHGVKFRLLLLQIQSRKLNPV